MVHLLSCFNTNPKGVTLLLSFALPLRFWLLRTRRGATAAGPPGRSVALELLEQTYYWPRM